MEGEPSPNGYSVKRLGAVVLALVAVVLSRMFLGDHVHEWRYAIYAVLVIGVYIEIALRKPDEKG